MARSVLTPCWVLAQNHAWALLGQMADICETAMIWVANRREPRSTLGWAWIMYKHYLGESSRDLKQLRKVFRSSHLGEVLSVGSGHDFKRNNLLSSCVPWVIRHLFWWILHMNLFTSSDEGMHFLSCKFCFKKHLEESEQFKTRLQFGRAHQPVKTNSWLSFNTID
jgi:hypothetical protein